MFCIAHGPTGLSVSGFDIAFLGWETSLLNGAEFVSGTVSCQSLWLCLQLTNPRVVVAVDGDTIAAVLQLCLVKRREDSQTFTRRKLSISQNKLRRDFCQELICLICM